MATIGPPRHSHRPTPIDAQLIAMPPIHRFDDTTTDAAEPAAARPHAPSPAPDASTPGGARSGGDVTGAPPAMPASARAALAGASNDGPPAATRPMTIPPDSTFQGVSSSTDGPGLALERIDEILRQRADRSRSRARLGLVVVLVGLLATGAAFVVPGIGDGGLAARLAGAAPGLVGMVIGGIVMAAARTRFARIDGLRRDGILARGRVRSVERGPLGVGRAIVFEYRDSGGHLHQAASDALSAEEAGRWPSGDSGLVLYDPSSISDAIWLGIRSSGH